MPLPIGTIVNILAVLAGSAIGLVFGARFPAGVRRVVFQGLGLATLAIGMRMALGFDNPLVLIFSILAGAIIGVVCDLDGRLNRLSERLKRIAKSDNEQFTDGLITAFVLFCVGSMTIMGTLDEGLRGDPTLLYTKSMLDGFASIALAATFGSGVLFSVVPLAIFQITLTVIAAAFAATLPAGVVTELSAVGGVLILGIGINLLGLARLKLTDFLPALPIAALLAFLLG